MQKRGDNVCTDAHIEFDIISERFIYTTDSKWKFSKLKMDSIKSTESVVFSPSVIQVLRSLVSIRHSVNFFVLCATLKPLKVVTKLPTYIVLGL